MAIFLLCPSMAERGKGERERRQRGVCSDVSSYKGIDTIMEALASSPNLNLVTSQRYHSKYPHTRSEVSRVQIWPGARRVLSLDFWWNLWKEAVSLPWGCYPGRTDTWAARSHLSHLAEKPVWEQSQKRRRMIMSKIQPQRLLFQLYSKLIIPLNKLISHFWLKPKWETEKAMASHSSTLAWKIPWMEEPGRLQSMGSLRVGHDWATSLSLSTFMHWRRKWQPTPVFLPGESQGWGSLVGCCLWGHTESDTTEVT